MSGKISNKENGTGTSRKSKLPMPVSAKKGVKRPNSMSDDQPETKKSPLKAKRQPLAETNTRRKIITVSKTKDKGMRKTTSSSSVNPAARQSQRLQNQKARRVAVDTRHGTAGQSDTVTSSTPSIFDQKGFEFEADESALQSILDNTGIERPQPQTAAVPPPSRHTLAGSTTTAVCTSSKSTGRGMFGKPQTFKKPDFHQWCEEFIHRISVHQSAAKRRCLGDKENKTDTGYKFDATRQSDVDFCGKYNVPSNQTFSSKPEQDASKCGRMTLSSFRTPGRLSLAAQTPQRVKSKEAKHQGTGGDLGSSARASMGPPTQRPVKLDSTTNAEPTEDEIKAPRLSLFGRPSLSAQTPGRVVVRPQADFAPAQSGIMSTDSRLSQGPGRVLKPLQEDQGFSGTQTPRLSLAAQTPSRVVKNGADRESFIVDPRLSLSAKSSGRIFKGSGENEGSMTAPRLSLAAQTPGRVPKTAPDSKDPRWSLAAQTPGRVPSSTTAAAKGFASNLKMNLESLLNESAPQTPGRVPKKGTETDRFGDAGAGAHTPLRVKTKSLFDSPMQTPGRVPKSKPSVSDLVNKTPLRELRPESTDRYGTPTRVLKSSEPALHTPLRVQNTQDTVVKHTPQRVTSTQDALIKHTPLRVQNKLENDNKQHTPQRVASTQDTVIKHTPLRVQNILDNGIKHTPQRVQNILNNDDKHTPQRILNTQLDTTQNHTLLGFTVGTTQTPNGESLGTPITPKRKHPDTSTDLNTRMPRTPVTPLQRMSLENSATPNEKVEGASRSSEKRPTPILKKGTPKSLFDGSQNGKGSPGLTTDLRSMWKTKKSANKTPVKREILTVVNGGVQKDNRSSPRPGRRAMTSDKKKKTLTWAGSLENFKSVGHKRSSENQLEKKLLFCKEENIDTVSKSLLFLVEEAVSYDDVIGPRTKDQQLDESENTAVIEDEARGYRAPTTLTSHNEMQESPSQENRNTSPPHQTSGASLPHPSHDTSALQDTMQLPVMVAGTPVLSFGERVAVDNDAWNQQVETKAATPDDLTSVAMSTLQSTRQSPQQPGHSQSEEWKVAASKKLEQIEEYLQNRLKSTNPTLELTNNNNTGQKSQTLDVSVSNSNNNNVDTVWRSQYYGDDGVVWNQSKSESDKVDNHSQGTYSSTPRALDVNSNITLSSAAQQTQETIVANVTNFSPNPLQNVTKTSSQTSHTHLFKSHNSPSTPTNKRQQDCDENLTPFILRNCEESVVETHDDCMEESQEPVEEMVIGSEAENQPKQSLQTGTLYFPTPLAAVKGEFVTQSETGTGIDLPIWTPLALRAAARQQNRGLENALNYSLGSCVDSNATTSDNNDERLVLSEISNNQNNREEKHNSPKAVAMASSKALNERKTAFRSLSQHGRLRPSAGPLSLRGNLNTSLKHKRQCRQSSHLQTLLQLEHKRFHEAVLDDEVELYMCRLAKRRMVGRQSECCNPVAKILTEGDDMCFVPVRDEEVHEKASGLESAFEKCMRST